MFYAIGIHEQHLDQIPPADRTIAHATFLRNPHDTTHLHKALMVPFVSFFTRYATLINHRRRRTGNFFHRPVKRVMVKDDDHLNWLVYYIHSNPAKHQVMANFRFYHWSSYQSLCSNKPTALERDAVLQWFGGLSNFIDFHGGTALSSQALYLTVDDE